MVSAMQVKHDIKLEQEYEQIIVIHTEYSGMNTTK